MAIKVAIDAGHGRHTAGKRCLKSIDPSETREWVLNARIAEKVIAHLERCGASVLRVDDASGKTDVPLSTRSAKINQWGADYSVSIHHDSGANGTSAGGTTVFVYSGPHSAKSDALQRAVYDGIVTACGKFGNRSKPRNSANFHMVREPSCPAVLVECGFMDSVKDTPMILTEAFAVKCALGIARGICQASGMKWIEPTSTIKKEEEHATHKSENVVLAWQKAAIADGFKLPKYGADGLWGAECISVARSAIVKQRSTYKYKNLTKIVQEAVGVTSDGLCGPATAKAIKAYQKKHGLTADGEVGLMTWQTILGVV